MVTCLLSTRKVLDWSHQYKKKKKSPNPYYYWWTSRYSWHPSNLQSACTCSGKGRPWLLHWCLPHKHLSDFCHSWPRQLWKTLVDILLVCCGDGMGVCFSAPWAGLELLPSWGWPWSPDPPPPPPPQLPQCSDYMDVLCMRSSVWGPSIMYGPPVGEPLGLPHSLHQGIC